MGRLPLLRNSGVRENAGDGMAGSAREPGALQMADLREGPAGAEHRFVGYEQLSVLVIFEKARA